MTSKDIKDELLQDLEATDEEAESVKGGFVMHAKSLATAKHAKSLKDPIGGGPIHG